MIEGSGEDALLAHFVAAQRSGIGRFSVDLDTGRWAWSASLSEIFGTTSDAAPPSWDLIVAHIPAPERETVEEAYRLAATRVGPFSWSHRILGDDGLLRSVLVIGETITTSAAGQGAAEGGDGPGVGRCLRGYVIDLTDLRVEGAQAAADEAVHGATAHRATIEQAKGALMLAYGLTPEAAFDLLSWRSQHANRKLHLIAADFVQALHDDNIADSRLRNLIDKLLADAESP